jgi:dihydroorotase
MNDRMLINNGHIIDPSQEIDGIGSILIEDGKIKEVIRHNKSKNSKTKLPNTKVIDCSGLYVFPGMIDMHCHLREPGFEYKETIATGTASAVRGGFTSVCCMPNTKPVNDNSTVTAFIMKKAMQEGLCNVYPIGAITKGQKGEELAEMGIMAEAGCIAFSDDGMPVEDSLIMRRALEYSKTFGSLVISHCEDRTLASGGVMNEGRLSAVMGLKGIPNASEEVMIARDIILAELTGAKLHIAHVSTAGAVALIKYAKDRGLKITAETCPHYFSITEDAVRGYNTGAKVNPPLRTQKDVDAIKEGLRNGIIDVIATDHAPHHRDEKMQEFDKAPFGISGFETALSLSLSLVHEGIITLNELVLKMSFIPAKILGINKGALKEGFDADIVIVDIDKQYNVDPSKFLSKGKNTPFEGCSLKGKAAITICNGKIHDIS